MTSIAILDVDVGGRCPACGDSIYGHNPKCSERSRLRPGTEKDGKRCGCPGPTAKQRAAYRDRLLEARDGSD